MAFAIIQAKESGHRTTSPTSEKARLPRIYADQEKQNLNHKGHEGSPKEKQERLTSDLRGSSRIRKNQDFCKQVHERTRRRRKKSGGLLAVFADDMVYGAQDFFSAGAGRHKGVRQFGVFDAGEINHDEPGGWAGFFEGTRELVALRLWDAEAENCDVKSLLGNGSGSGRKRWTDSDYVPRGTQYTFTFLQKLRYVAYQEYSCHLFLLVMTHRRADGLRNQSAQDKQHVLGFELGRTRSHKTKFPPSKCKKSTQKYKKHLKRKLLARCSPALTALDKLFPVRIFFSGEIFFNGEVFV
jgi:hypothetical protein